MIDLTAALELRQEAIQAKETNRIKYYDPYPYQKRFHDAGHDSRQRLLMAGNRIGKTYSGAAELAMHATGLYPDWWEGRRFSKPVKTWACGKDNIKTRDICQAELLGEPGNPFDRGKGAIPMVCLGEVTRKPGIPNAIEAIMVRHISGGWSKVAFKSYEMGAASFMGESLDVIWLDEEPPQPIYSQAITRVIDRGGMTYMTFTPENGMTEVVAQFMNDLRIGQSMTIAGWDDASEEVRTIVNGKPGHLNKEVREQALAAMTPHERDMRSRGIPLMGSGLVFPVDDGEIMVKPFEIPNHFYRIAAIDFGWDHPTAIIWIAWDKDTDVIYVYDAWREANKTPPIIAAAINSKTNWVSVVWPHDGNRADGMGGPSLADQFRKLNVKMHYTHFSNPPGPGQKEGQGGNSVEPGVIEVLTRMQTGRLKVFSNLTLWFEEKNMYHRKDGKIVPKFDDLMSATRYAVQSRRFARVNDARKPPTQAITEFNVYGHELA